MSKTWHNYNLRPRRPPFLRVESDGIGVTSSIRPIFIPARARALRADWAPGPGVLVRLPPEVSKRKLLNPEKGILPKAYAFAYYKISLTRIETLTSSPHLNVKSSDSEGLDFLSNILGSQHSGVGRSFITISLDFHSSGDTAQSFPEDINLK